MAHTAAGPSILTDRLLPIAEGPALKLGFFVERDSAGHSRLAAVQQDVHFELRWVLPDTFDCTSGQDPLCDIETEAPRGGGAEGGPGPHLAVPTRGTGLGW